MKYSVVAFIALAIPVACLAQAQGVPAFRLGEAIWLEFSYDGGIDGWDGHIGVGQIQGEPSLTISNSAFWVLTRGDGPFVPAQADSHGKIYSWQLQTAMHGELVEPIGERVRRVAYNIIAAEPFRTVLDLTEFYRIVEPGVYHVYWGMGDLWAEEICFKVLPSAVVTGTVFPQRTD